MTIGFAVWRSFGTLLRIISDRNRLTDTENRLMVAKGEWGSGGMDWELRLEDANCKLL